MKKILLLLVVILIGFSSCKKKETFHKITYEVTMLGKPGYGHSNFFEVSVYPNDLNNRPESEISGSTIKVWKYDYYQLTDGDKVDFGAFGQLSYYYEMRVYIDDVEVSYVRAVVDDYTYYATYIEERRGINDVTSNSSPSITFTYHEN